MKFFITNSDLEELRKSALIFNEASTISVATYSFIVSRAIEAAMNGMSYVEFPAEGLEGLEEVIAVCWNGYFYILKYGNTVRVSWQ
ncbi:MAG: hypothetical protein E6772_16040 [Dysgonomonas sp.]|nr:hypothetical protein [Dysgonomonas sp.]